MPSPDRRQFLAGSAAACALARAGWAAGTGGAAPRPEWVLHDVRFPPAAAAARRLHGGGTLLPVTGHVSELLPAYLERLAAGDGFGIGGVTTGAVPFCLQQLLRPPRAARLVLRRLDRDLFSWTLAVLPGGAAA